MQKIFLIKTILILASFEVLGFDEVETFSGCIGKDVTGREVKVESLSRSLENCAFAKVYLKENEEKYKANLDEKIIDSLKTSLDQDLETLMLQGEFFESLGINLLNYGSNTGIKESCQLDKMTDVDNCGGSNTKEYERRKKSLLSSFGVEDSKGFNQKIKDRFKQMTGRSEKNFCPLIGSDENNLDQFLLYQSSLTKASLLQLRKYLDQEISLINIQAKFPMLDLIFKGDEKTAQKFIEEIKAINGNQDPNLLAKSIKDKITSFYSDKGNAQTISKTMENTCLNFNKKIKKFICADDLNYETRNGAMSKRLFEGFDMSLSDLSRNKRVKLQDKEMAFMAFGKKCEIDEREESLVVTEKRQTLDGLIGDDGIYIKGNRDLIEDSLKKDNQNILRQIAFCQYSDEKLKGQCSEDKPIEAKKLREIYSCPESDLCNKNIELAANYLEGCEKRAQKAKRLAEKPRDNSSSDNSGTISIKDPLDLDFFDNLLADSTSTPEKSVSLTKKDESGKNEKPENTSLAKNESKTSGDLYAPKSKKGINEGEESSPRNGNSSASSLSANGIYGSKAVKDEKSTRTSSGIIKAEGPKKITRAEKASAVTSRQDNVDMNTQRELSERLARLEGQHQGYKNGLEDASRRYAINNEGEESKGSKKAKKGSSSSKNWDDSVYRKNLEGSLDEEDFSDGENPRDSVAKSETLKDGQKIGSQAQASKASGLNLSSVAGKKDDSKEDPATEARLVLSLLELSTIDEAKLNQLWKNRDEKFIIGIKGEGDLREKMILTLDKDKKPMIENFQSLSLKTRESILKSKLFKDFKIIRQKELNELIKKAGDI